MGKLYLFAGYIRFIYVLFLLALLNTLCWQIALCCLNLIFKVDYARDKAISCLRLKYAYVKCPPAPSVCPVSG